MIVPFTVWSQQRINSEVFFNSGLDNFMIEEKNNGETMNFPWIEKYDFRTETRDSEFDRQEYMIRFSTNSSKIRNAQKALYEEMKNAPDFEGQDSYCDRLMRIHNDWLSLYIINENKKILQQLLVVLDDKKSIYEKMFGGFQIDPSKILRLKSDRTDIKISLQELRIKQECLLKQYGFSSIAQLEFQDFVTIENITKHFYEKLISNKDILLKDEEIEHKIKLLNKEMELVSAEQRKVLDFVQFKYTGPHSDLIKERLSIGLAFQLSNSGSKKLKIQELKLEQEELNIKSKRTAKEDQKEIEIIAYELQKNIQMYSYFLDITKEEREELETLSTNISQSQEASPLLLLNIKERNLSLKLDSLKIKKSLLDDYLTYLLKSEILCSTNGVNYLAN